MKEISPVVVDARREGEPISKYIYSQFIEHLGRCIQGGIWAEMLEDRKFYDAIGEGESPWHAIGVVEMDTVEPFVGAHTPLVTLTGDSAPGGIAHGGLSLVAAREYVGRVWLQGTPSVGFVTVSLVWGPGASDRDTVTISPVSDEWTKHPLRFTAGAATDDARLEIISKGGGTYRIGTVSLMPSDNVNGMRRDTLQALRELDSPLYRWPGGNFVSGYDWRDGVGDRDRRPPRKNPAWKGIEYNDFGLHEFLDFCELLNTEPLIVVNTGFGDAQSAVQELEYVNGGPETPMGAWRMRNGHKEPWGVKWWGIGNEMFGDWQLGHMSLQQYVHKHNDFERKMRAQDPGIITIGVGEHGPWSEGFMPGCAEHMDYISEHFYCKDKEDIAEHVAQMPAAIKGKCDAHRQYRRDFPELKGKDIRIAMDEWNYWYGPDIYGELGTRYFIKDNLGIAAGLHEYFRNSDLVYMANYAQTVNVIGCIKTTPTNLEWETTGLVLKMYRQHFGTKPLAISGVSEPLDVAAALTEDGSRLTVAVVNPTGEAKSFDLSLDSIALQGTGSRYAISDPDPMAHNAPEMPRRIDIVSEEVAAFSGEIAVEPYGVALYSLTTKA